mgnify:FL=1|jgi:uncharacterized protein
MNLQHAKLIAAMTAYDKGDAMRIQHFMKVHDFSAVIGTLEGVDAETLFILETASIVHDIGIHESERKYGSSNGKYQEIEGPGEASKLLKQVGGYSQEQIDRVCYLVGHHHTYTNIDGVDYQILVEADFLVNIYEDTISPEAVTNVREKIFRTASGRRLLDDIYDLCKNDDKKTKN